jgi:hypothetical protein
VADGFDPLMFLVVVVSGHPEEHGQWAVATKDWRFLKYEELLHQSIFL